jgi:predicted RNase H-like HicB family nuclease
MKIELHIDYFEEDGTIVALCSELQVSSFGDTLDDAEKSIKEALELFFEGCGSLGTIDEVLEESGFRQVGDKWVHRQPIKTTKTTFQPAMGAASYA